MQKKNETAIFGGGCFWCTEAVFLKLKGVKEVTPGYAGGKKANPSYEEVSGGKTGYAEVIKIIYNRKDFLAALLRGGGGMIDECPNMS